MENVVSLDQSLHASQSQIPSDLDHLSHLEKRQRKSLKNDHSYFKKNQAPIGGDNQKQTACKPVRHKNKQQTRPDKGISQDSTREHISPINHDAHDVTVPFDNPYEGLGTDSDLVLNGLNVVNAVEVICENETLLPSMLVEEERCSPETLAKQEQLICEFDGKARQVSTGVNKHGHQMFSVKCWYGKCTKHFRTFDAVREHESRHEKEVAFCRCTGCINLSFNFQCTKCSEVYQVTIYRDHIFLSTYVKDGIWIECTKCAALSLTLMSRVDTQVSTVDSVVKFVCDGPTCNKLRFSTLGAMRLHRTKWYQCTSESQAMLSVVNRMKKFKKALYKCPKQNCVRAFKQRYGLRVHQLRHRDGNKRCLCRGCTPTGKCSSYYDLTCSNCQKEFCIFIHGKNSLFKEFMDEGILIQCTSCENVAREQIRIHSDLAEKANVPTEQIRIHSDLAEKADFPTEQIQISSDQAEKAEVPTEQIGIRSDRAEKAEGPTEQIGIPSDQAEKAGVPTEQIGIPSDRAEKAEGPTEQIRIHSDLAEKAEGPTEQISVHPSTRSKAGDLAHTMVLPHFVCNIWKCKQKIFQTLRDITLHRHRHHAVDQFSRQKSCEKCDEVLNIRSSSTYESHLSTCPENVDVTRCDTCGRLCRNIQHLKVHRQHSHPGKSANRRKQEIVCDVCGRLCSSVGRLNIHMDMVHHNRLQVAGEKHKCSECGAVFNHVKKLAKHKHRVHKADGILCSKCGKLFRTRRSLLYHHERAHEEKMLRPKKTVLCTACNKSFSCKRYLKIHRRSMHGEVDDTPV